MLSMKEVSDASGLSEDTIRYYEKIGLLPRIARKTNGHRAYGQEDLRKLHLINCLKKTGMPLDDMKPYVSASPELSAEAFPELRGMMLTHRERIRKQMASLQEVLDLIDTKLAEGESAYRNCEGG
jgi:DNA-binding transcriptional MerR regulator